MIRHIFMGTFRAGVTQDEKQTLLQEMRRMKDEIPTIAVLHVGLALGWTGGEDRIVVTADVKDRADFDAYLGHPYHAEHVAALSGRMLEEDSYTMAQIEL